MHTCSLDTIHTRCGAAEYHWPLHGSHNQRFVEATRDSSCRAASAAAAGAPSDLTASGEQFPCAVPRSPAACSQLDELVRAQKAPGHGQAEVARRSSNEGPASGDGPASSPCGENGDVLDAFMLDVSHELVSSEARNARLLLLPRSMSAVPRSCVAATAMVSFMGYPQISRFCRWPLPRPRWRRKALRLSAWRSSCVLRTQRGRIMVQHHALAH